jgi:hypothetical protein
MKIAIVTLLVLIFVVTTSYGRNRTPAKELPFTPKPLQRSAYFEAWKFYEDQITGKIDYSIKMYIKVFLDADKHRGKMALTATGCM